MTEDKTVLCRMSRKHRGFAALLFALLATAWPAPRAHAANDDPLSAITARYASEVNMRLEVPTGEQRAYAARLQAALSAAGVRDPDPQFFLLVDRSPVVQAAFVYWYSPPSTWRLIGASPAATGHAGGFEYFITPLGVFEHTLANLDFRAEGTYNQFGIRGYGVRGMRIYDFGWVEGERTWDQRGRSPMRLQVHATDPDLLEPHLGRPRSKGCIRIPATLNTFLDRHGLLDAEYEQAVKQGRHFWVLLPDRQPVTAPGKYLVVVDSGRTQRPPWSPPPPWPRKGAKKSVTNSDTNSGVC
jgi:hypothetical protein